MQEAKPRRKAAVSHHLLPSGTRQTAEGLYEYELTRYTVVAQTAGIQELQASYTRASDISLVVTDRTSEAHCMDIIAVVQCT